MKQDMYDALNEIHSLIGSMQQATSILCAALESMPTPNECKNKPKLMYATNLLSSGQEIFETMTEKANDFMNGTIFPLYFANEKLYAERGLTA